MSSSTVILVPTDFGDSAELALDHAIEIARALKARIVLLYSFPIPYMGLLDGAMVPTDEVMGAMRDAGTRGLEKAMARVKDRGIEIRPVSIVGDPQTRILEVAKETNAQLIVMGTHGRRGLSRLLLGSTAETIVRTSPVPVLTVRAKAEAPDLGATTTPTRHA
jgi:nucleotide-binding universal stress UspA family protein